MGQVYSSALLYDPATGKLQQEALSKVSWECGVAGQYKNQLYQSLPQSEGQFGFNQRIQPYVQQQQQQRRPVTLQLQAQPTPAYRQQQVGYNVYDDNMEYWPMEEAQRWRSSCH